MKKINAIIIKELMLLFRDPGGLMMLFILPASFIFILSISLQGTFSSPDKREKMDIIVVNDDRGEMGSQIITGLESVGYFNVITDLAGKPVTTENAKKELQKGTYRIIIHIPPMTTDALNFKEKAVVDVLVDPVISNDFAAHITNAIQTFVYVSIIKNIGQISMNIFNDIKNKRIEELGSQVSMAKVKQKELEQQLKDVSEVPFDDDVRELIESLSKASIDELSGKVAELEKQIKQIKGEDDITDYPAITALSEKEIGLKVSQKYYNPESGSEVFPNSVQQNVPGWTIFALFWIVQILALNIITERRSGAFKRILISPVSSFQFFAGKIIPFFLINMLQALCMLAIGVFILPLFGCPPLVIQNLPALLILTAAISIVAISMGIFFASVCRTVFLAASLSASIMIILAVLGGIMVPRFVMPRAMQTMSLFVPHGWALDGYLNILVKNYSLMQILPNIGMLLLFATVFIVISLPYFKRSTL